MKFFEQSKVNWNRFRPTDIVFKSNAMVKKLVPSENILSYSTKSNRDVEMAQRSGGEQNNKSIGQVKLILIIAEINIVQFMLN